jgi:hemolysin III
MSKTPYLRENDEEVYNALTHAVGFGLFVAGTIAVFLRGWNIDPVWGIAGFIYGFSQTLTYLTSSVYHIISSPVIKKKWRLIDHLTIYLAIAGTYTPIFVIGLSAPWSYILVILMWGLCCWGAHYKYHHIGENEVFSVILYLILGWVGILVFGIATSVAIQESFDLIIGGGLVYTVGTYFYYSDYTKYHHTLWHIMVLIASAIHYYAVWNYFIVAQ